MCLIVFAWRAAPGVPLALVANRDEYHRRPTEPARFWADAPDLLAGRDLQAGGTWLGVTRSGRFAAITNYRDGCPAPLGAPSRGELVSRYLLSDSSPRAWLRELEEQAKTYCGFNMLLGNIDNLYYFSNRGGLARRLSSGVYGLSNHLLNTPWPKVVIAREALVTRMKDSSPLDADALTMMMRNRWIPPDRQLPDTGVGIELERTLAPMFIETPDYGTRSITGLVISDQHQVSFVEHTTVPRDGGRVSYRFVVPTPARGITPS